MSEWKWAEWPAGGVGEGWRSIVQPLVDLCEQRGIEIHQIKEKFGGLRFYVGEVPDDVHEAINTAERQSEETCEKCGQPGIIRYGSWMKTLCDDCATNNQSSN